MKEINTEFNCKNRKRKIKKQAMEPEEEIEKQEVFSTIPPIRNCDEPIPKRNKLSNIEANFNEERKRKRSVSILSLNSSKVENKKRKTINFEVNKRIKLDQMKTPRSQQDGPISNSNLSNELHNAYQTNQYRNHYPHQLIGLMYRLDLSVLCSLRKFTFAHKYPSLRLAIGDSEIDEFSNFVLHYKEKSIHVRIENVDKYYVDNGIGYAELFSKRKQDFSIIGYFNSFVKHLISKPNSLSNDVEYLFIYTNVDLDLTEDKILKKGRSRNFYPFKFDSINIEECDILKDFLFIKGKTKGSGFYQFSRDKATREELLKRLEISSVVQKAIKERKVSQEEIKKVFLDKLIFALNQPNREELNSIIKSEMEKAITVGDDYIALQERILWDLTASETDKKHRKLRNYIPGIIYEFNLLVSFLHVMFLHKKIFSLNSEEMIHDTSNNIALHYKDKITYIKVHNANSNIDYKQLFPSGRQERKNIFSINNHFSLFIETLEKDKKIKYFIIYTNADLDLTEVKMFKKGQFKDSYPLKFDNIDIKKKRYKILIDCACINKNSLYKFTQEEPTREKLLSLLKLPPSLQKEKEKGRLSDENEKEVKELFLDKLILAVSQPNMENLNSIRNEIYNSNVPYNYEELHEIALRWSESHEVGPITEGIMEKLLEDIKNNRFSGKKIEIRPLRKKLNLLKVWLVKKEHLPLSSS